MKFAINTSNGQDLEAQVNKFVGYLSYNVTIIHSQCLEVLLPFICRWVFFPTCEPALDKPVGQRVCRRACEILTFICPEAWRIYIEQFHILDVPKGFSFTCANLMYADGGDVPDCIDPLGGGK